jgi:hypothetical protein
MGCLIPLLILTYSLYSIHRGHITPFGKGNSTKIHGDDLPALPPPRDLPSSDRMSDTRF